MAFDTLQRWHETHHVDTSGYHVIPPHIPAIPRYSPFPAIAQGLEKILPQLDPLSMAQRKLAMESLPLQEAKIKGQLQMLPLQQQMQGAQLQAMLKAYQNGGIDPSTNKPFTTEAIERLKKAKEKANMDSIYDRYNHFDTFDATQPQAGSDINPQQSDMSGQPIPDLSGAT